MTLDDFLSALENLIEDRETSDDVPGEGNFSCEDCRACNHCRFCIGCDTCEDCTYCDECMESTSCTQCKRCVSCEKVSYCDDSRDCKASRYLTLCVACTDCVHCLACVGLTGAEFYVLNERRTRKEYFALLRQVQELMQTRMAAGWRPPGIGLASEIIDAVVANRDPTLSAAPWLVSLDDGRGDDRGEDLGEDLGEDPDDELRPDLRGGGDIPAHRDVPAYRDPPMSEPRDTFDVGRERPGRGPVYDDRPRPAAPQLERRPAAQAPGPGSGARREDNNDAREDNGYAPRDPDEDEPRSDAAMRSISDWAREPPEYGSSYLADPDLGHDDRVQARAPHEPHRDRARARPRHDYGEDLGRDLSEDLHEPDVPRRQDQLPTQPFTRRPGREFPDPAPVRPAPAPRGSSWEDSRERTAARAPTRRGEPQPDDDAVAASPWDDGDDRDDRGDRGDRATVGDTRGSLRLAGRPKRPPQNSTQSSNPREATGTGSYRTGSAPERTGSGSGSGSGRGPGRSGGGSSRTGSEGTHTGGTGLRLGRKPKR